MVTLLALMTIQDASDSAAHLERDPDLYHRTKHVPLPIGTPLSHFTIGRKKYVQLYSSF